VAVFKVGGKIYATVSLEGATGQLSLKCDPGCGRGMRAVPRYTAGYDLNERHWNTLILDGSVPPDARCEWIEDSYDLVLETLTWAERTALD